MIAFYICCLFFENVHKYENCHTVLHFQGVMAFILYALLRNPCLASCISPQGASSYSMNGHIFDPTLSTTGAPPGPGQYQFHPTTLDAGSLKGSRASLLNEVGRNGELMFLWSEVFLTFVLFLFLHGYTLPIEHLLL